MKEKLELINKCRHHKFTLLRHDSKDWKFRFHWDLSCSIPIQDPVLVPFWSARLMFCMKWFSKQKSSSSKLRFHCRILRVIFLVNTAWKREWRHSFVWVLWHSNFFVIRYYLLTEDWRSVFVSLLRDYFTLCTYSIIMEHSFMNMNISHGAKKVYITYIYIYIYILHLDVHIMPDVKT